MNQKAYKTKTRIFKNAGYIVLTRRLADGTLSKNPDDIYTSDTTIVQSVSTKYSLTTEQMEDGNSFFPAASHVTGVDAVTEVTFNTLDPKLWEFMVGAETTTVENGYYRDTADQYIIPDDGVVKINASALQPESLVLARKTNGEDFIMGEDFEVDYENATLTFSDTKALAGTVILVTSYKQSALVTTSSVEAIPKQGSYKMELIGENCDKDETDVVADNYVVSNVKVSGDVSQPIRQKNYNSYTATFSIGTPAPGEKAIDWVSAVKSERSAEDAAPDATLSSLSLGSLILSPQFSPAVTDYTTTTSNSTNTITATATDSSAKVSIDVNGSTVESGNSATWNDSENTVTIKVTNGSATKTYKITVTKE